MYLNSMGPDRPQAVYFYDAGEPTGQSIYWDDAGHRFWLSADTTIEGSLTMNDDLKINGNELLIGQRRARSEPEARLLRRQRHWQ